MPILSPCTVRYNLGDYLNKPAPRRRVGETIAKKQNLSDLADMFTNAVGLDKLPVIQASREYIKTISLPDLIDSIGKLDAKGLKFVLALGVPTEAQQAVIARSRDLRGG